MAKKSWFYGLGLAFSFWGDEWGEILSGVMEDKPRFYTGLEGKGEYKYFEYISELDGCRKLVHRLQALDAMMARLAKIYPLEKDTVGDTQSTFHRLLFNLWARRLLNLESCFSSISADQAKAFFGHLRAGEEAPPYKMAKFKDIFIKDFMACDPDIGSELSANLEDALSLVWQEFAEEYEGVATGDLKGIFTKFVSIED